LPDHLQRDLSRRAKGVEIGALEIDEIGAGIIGPEAPPVGDMEEEARNVSPDPSAGADRRKPG
jgi:hypothetical protein